MPQALVEAMDIEITGRLRTVIGHLGRRLRRTRAGEQLTSTQTSLLSAAVRRGPVGLSKLAEAEGMNPTMLSRVVRRLEEAGLLIRLADPVDGRAALVEATAAGRLLDEQIHSERNDVLHRIVDQLEPSERRALVAALPVLERIADSLKPRRS